MKAILLLAALHLMIMHQSQKKNGKKKEVLPTPASAPVRHQPIDPADPARSYINKNTYPVFFTAFTREGTSLLSSVADF